MERVILLNSDYSFLNTIHWKKAVKLIAKGKAEVLKASNIVMESAINKWQIVIPKVLRLLKLVRTVYKTKVPFSSKNVFTRDNFTCQYCGIKKVKMTLDHVIPVSRGGQSTFENCVASCRKCNNDKGNKTPREAGMSLRKQPKQPTIMEFIQTKMKNLGVEKYLKELGVY